MSIACFCVRTEHIYYGAALEGMKRFRIWIRFKTRRGSLFCN